MFFYLFLNILQIKSSNTHIAYRKYQFTYICVLLCLLSYFVNREFKFNEIDGWHHIQGNRIVELDYVLQWALQAGSEHSRKCSNPSFRVIRAYDACAITSVIFECVTCGELFRRRTEDPANRNQIRRSLIVGTLISGGTHATTGELLAVCDIPWIAFKTFLNDEEKMDQTIAEEVEISLNQAVKDEIKLSPVASDGKAEGTAYVDGCYATRSYGKGFRSTSGGAVIVGHCTKKVLYGATKNIYCLRCSLNKKRDKSAKHICHKNFDGNAGQIEPAVTYDGLTILDEAGLRVTKLIADGDCTSSDYAKDHLTFGELIELFRCRNHITRGFRRRIAEVCLFLIF